MNKCFFGDCRQIMRQLIDDGVKVQTCVTSPPYWGLRDYGVEGQLGLEPTPEESVANMVEVFELVKELLADDGTLWLNLGDSYSSGGRVGYDPKGSSEARGLSRNTPSWAKPKDLIGIPWRVAFALQAKGWYLRSDIIWHKPNPMPESVTDRPTKAHEYLFLLSKNERYYYDAEAIKEPASPDTHARYARGRSNNHKWADGGPGNQTIAKSFEHMRKPGVNPKAAPVPTGWDTGKGAHNKKNGRYRPKQNESFAAAVKDIVEERNKRSVWTIPSIAYSEAHFATFPPKLIEPCILAGSRPGDIVLDPFMGSGTTAQVAEQLGRQWIGIELNEDYEKLQRDRTAQTGMKL